MNKGTIIRAAGMQRTNRVDGKFLREYGFQA